MGQTSGVSDCLDAASEVEARSWNATALFCGDFGKKRYIPNVRELLGKHSWFFILAAVAAVGLRIIFIFYFPGVTNDSFIYGDIAKNWLQHGIFGLSGANGISPTDIRLPGYPAFVAAIFAIFGVDHYRAVLIAQLFVDMGTCLICADLARRLLGNRAAKIGFLLAALCPFLANYSAAALTETLEIFFTALALDLVISGVGKARMAAWIGCGLACAAAILLRPDGALLLIVIDLYLLACLLLPGSWVGARAMGTRVFIAVGWVTALALAPLVPWAIRNYRVVHRFQPLAPRYANEEGEFVPMGFNRWTKTWIADYVSVEEVYWAVPGSKIDMNNLPSRAFDSPQQRQETERIIAEYNDLLHVSRPLDAEFAALAQQRIRSHLLRYYVWLPCLRIIDMWLRPRTEMLPSDTRWWEFDDDPRWSALAIGLGLIGLLYLSLALIGLARFNLIAGSGLMILFVVARSLFLGSLENPEPRYTLEMYPVVIFLAAAALAGSARIAEKH